MELQVIKHKGIFAIETFYTRNALWLTLANRTFIFRWRKEFAKTGFGVGIGVAFGVAYLEIGRTSFEASNGRIRVVTDEH